MVGTIHEHRHYTSIEDYLADAEKAPDLRYVGGDWVGGVTWEQAMSLARNGVPDLVPAAEKIADMLPASQMTSTEVRGWTYEVAGMWPQVPAYVAGDPEHMAVPAQSASTSAPLEIYISCNSASQVGTQTLIARGAATTAYALAQSKHRPVNLLMFWEIEDHPHYASATLELDLRIVDMSRVVFFLAHPAAWRMLGFSVFKHITGSRLMSGRPLYSNPRALATPAGRAAILSRLGAPSNAVVTERAENEPLRMIRSKPVDWLTDNLRKNGLNLDGTPLG